MLTVPQILPLAECYYRLPGNGVGGSLHIVLDDMNVADQHVRFCMDYAAQEVDRPGYFLAHVLLNMSKTQRRKLAHAIAWQPDATSTESEFWQIVADGHIDIALATS